MIRAIIVDDELAARENLRLLIAENCEDVHVVAEARNVPEAEEVITKHQPDVVFLDVDMPGQSGFDLLDRISTNPKVIFTTGYEKYAVKAFKVSAVDYLVKPVDVGDLVAAVKKVNIDQPPISLDEIKQLLNGGVKSDRITVSTAEEIHLIEPSSVAYIEADRNYSIFHLEDQRKIIATKSLSDFEKILEKHRFYRVHKSFLVNLNHVEIYRKGRGGQLILRSGQIVDVARNKKEELLKQLEQF